VLSLKADEEKFVGASTPDGYVVASYVLEDGTRTMAGVHVLVMEAFVGPRRPGMQVRHLDSDPSNNTLENLTWGTPSENYQDRVERGTDNSGANSGRSKLEYEQVMEIRQRVSELQADLAEEYGVSQGHISRIVTKGNWPDGCVTRKVIGLTKEQVLEIRSKPEVLQKEWAAKFGVSQATISRAKKGKTWRSLDV